MNKEEKEWNKVKKQILEPRTLKYNIGENQQDDYSKYLARQGIIFEREKEFWNDVLKPICKGLLMIGMIFAGFYLADKDYFMQQATGFILIIWGFYKFARLLK